jgi:hypothetical protein
VLDEAIRGLPPKYRVPFVLCYLEGMTNAQAARQLGCPPGTVATRLARARERLRARLRRRGLTVGAGLLGLAPATRTAAAVPPPLLAATARAAAGGAIPPAVTTLMEGVCKAMLLDKVRTLVLALAALVAVGGVGMGTYRALAGEEPPAREEPPQRVAPFPSVPGVPVAEPAPVAPPPIVQEASYRTANFVVTAPTRRYARLVAEAAEQQRRTLALRWLRKELPDWKEPCRVRVNLPNSLFPPGAAPKADGHATSFSFENGRVTVRDMHLEGQLERILATSLPHEVTHTVLASHFRAPVPRWADEGAAMQAEDEEQQQRFEGEVRRLLAVPARIIPLRRLLPMPDYPKDLLPLYAEGYSLTRFLIKRRDPATFLAFVAQGMQGNWDGGARMLYGFDGVEELEQDWRAWLAGEDKKAAAAEEAHRPVGMPPVTGLASLDAKGRLILRVRGSVYNPVTSVVERDGGRVETTSYVRVGTTQQWLLDPQKVEAYDLDGERVSPEALTEALAQEAVVLGGLKREGHLRPPRTETLARETAVLVSMDGHKVDPYHLQLIKKGTLIFVLPVPPAQPPMAEPLPAASVGN